MDESTAMPPANDLSRPVAASRDDESYSVSVPEVSEMFAAAGLPRTERAIQRFCKKGELKWALVDTPYGSKYLITRSSIERLIIQKQQAQKFAPTIASTDVSRPAATGRDLSRQEQDFTKNVATPAGADTAKDHAEDANRDTIPQQRATPDTDTDPALEKLKSEIFDLKVDNAGKQNFIRQLAAEREKFLNDVRELSYNLGAAESRLMQLEAPQQYTRDMSRHVATVPGDILPLPVEEGRGAVEPTAAQPKPSEPSPAPRKRHWLWG